MKVSIKIFFYTALVCFFSTFTQAQALDDRRVFDAYYYLSSYPDLQKAFNGDRAQAKQHWLDVGIKEGRQASPNFDAAYYLGHYADLQQTFGATNYEAAIKHWLTLGINEKRSGIVFDDPRVFNATYYYYDRYISPCHNCYPGRRLGYDNRYYNTDLDSDKEYWLKDGIKKGEQASPTFNAVYYLGLYPDLQQAFGAKNYKEATKHWLNHGIAEGRTGVDASKRTNMDNVRYIQFMNDKGKSCGFAESGWKEWDEFEEGKVVYKFKEVNKDKWSVYLQDASRGVALQLDLHTSKVMISSIDGSNRRFLYDILWSIKGRSIEWKY